MKELDFVDYLTRHTAVFEAIQVNSYLQELKRIGDEIVETIVSGGKMIFFGNGGSSAEASHFATELISKCTNDHNPWPAISLADSSSNITAIGNDYGFSKIFSRQIEGIAKVNDFVIGFSTSGNSENVLEALRVASDIGCKTLLFTGSKYNHMSSSRWRYLAVPSDKTTLIQEVHLWQIHALSEYCELKLK
jgi:D-sedoheptulose 7-phosphate isomerase